jgi:seryl-tRNA synthetase
MLDLRLIRSDPDAVRGALARRGDVDAGAVDAVLALDAERRGATEAAETLRARQKTDARAVAAAQKAGDDASEAILAARELATEVKERAAQATTADRRLQTALAALPNLPDPTAPAADDVLREVGEIRALDFAPQDHLALAGARVDMERGARLSGSRFAYLRGDLVFLELALVQWTLRRLERHGFEPVVPPALVREEALHGTGFLPDTEQQIYHLPADELYLAGTSEVALASMHAGEVLDAESLPRRYAGFSPCFRREAGTAGRDTRGIFRVHQFDKVEMFSFVRPGESAAEHERLLAIEEEILTELQIPYRVVNIAVDDLGASAAKKYDCEAWLPGQGQYRELTSTSNTTDFQARRLDVRFREATGKPAVLHTLNGTAVAVGRTLIALMENGQLADGSVELPGVLAAHGAPARLAPSE